MTKVSIYAGCSGATIRPDGANRITVDADDVELTEVIESIDNNALILEAIELENIAEWINEENKLHEVLGYFDDVALVDYLKSQGWELKNESDD